jgi:hypothetical protein
MNIKNPDIFVLDLFVFVAHQAEKCAPHPVTRAKVVLIWVIWLIWGLDF